jgi:hypothetical protein
MTARQATSAISLAAPLLAAILAGCGSSHGQSASSPSTVLPVLNGPIGRDVHELARQGFTVDGHIVSSLPGGTLLYVFHSVCAGSIDGSCQEVSVFRGDGSHVAWHHHYTGPSAISASNDGFMVKFEEYRPTDPICCPSGPSILSTYRWDGRVFVNSTRTEPHS